MYNHNNKIKIFAIIGVLCVVFGFTACGEEVTIHTPPPREPVLTEIVIYAGDHVLEGVIFDNETAEEFAKSLPQTVELWNPAPGFAKAFNLDEPIADTVRHTRKYAKGGLAYWCEGPSIALFYGDHLAETIVSVITIGQITSNVDFLKDYEGEITIAKKAENRIETETASYN